MTGLSREQGNNIKGWAIIFIALANMFRHVLHMTSNEMAYSPVATQLYRSHVFASDSYAYSIGFLGWYGVVLFVFLSGFGLTRKYGDNLGGLSTWDYFKRHVVKLWKLMLPLMLLYVVLDGLLYDGWSNYNVWELMRQALFVINFLDFDNLTPGTYWFFGLIIQFYLLYALVVRRMGNRWLLAVAVLGLVILYLNAYLSTEVVSKWIRHNFTGWITPFALGVVFARTMPKLPARTVAALVAVGAFLLFGVSAAVRCGLPLSELFVIAALVSLAIAMPWRPVAYVGRISSSVFVVYPLVQLAMKPWLRHDASLPYFAALYLVAVIAASALHYFIMHLNKKRAK